MITYYLMTFLLLSAYFSGLILIGIYSCWQVALGVFLCLTSLKISIYHMVKLTSKYIANTLKGLDSISKIIDEQENERIIGKEEPAIADGFKIEDPM